METTELLLRRGADFTATDKKCFTPILACAKDDNVALCLASMLVEYFKNTSSEGGGGDNRASVGKAQDWGRVQRASAFVDIMLRQLQ